MQMHYHFYETSGHMFQPSTWRTRRLFIRPLTVDRPGMRDCVSRGHPQYRSTAFVPPFLLTNCGESVGARQSVFRYTYCLVMFDVYLYVYDLSCGVVKALSPIALGKQIDGIWHTSVVLHNKEYFYGSHGISFCTPEHTVLGKPGQKVYMGQTSVTEAELSSYLEHLALTSFRSLPADVASTPLGAVLETLLNTLSVGLNNVPQFGLEATKEIGVTTKLVLTTSISDTNNHCFEDIRRSFVPILFDEPLSSDILPHRVHLLWSGDDHSTKAELAVDVTKLVVESQSSVNLNPEHYSLLELSELETADQCLVVCELFRLALWRDPDLLTAMLTDPDRRLHRLAVTELPVTNPNEVLNLTVAKAKLLCNYLGLSQDWPLEGNRELVVELRPILNICLLLLGHDEHQLPGHDSRTLLPDHRYTGLALAHNLALNIQLSDEEALELGTYLIHLAVVQDKSYKQPVEATYLLRSIYFLVVRFPILADLARTYDLCGCLTVVMNEATNPETAKLGTRPGKSVPVSSSNGSNGVVNVESTSIDYLIVTHLLDYLTLEDGQAV
ncbi:hypothetical protein T265_05751 [Opisthorchis viverrini]|uniref:PPPDE domain-containing protein n=1 Tax=Opisthorchis viverrini TaxID=6198 RepID=A0A074ZN10_OPIVI|nr:hypothetical protein T265_05751 [Opisthorchis viverrini]KER27132.1 hypothetical protein T265_05751 [Opisthorchis viverrini]